jgi:hypothetical protein
MDKRLTKHHKVMKFWRWMTRNKKCKAFTLNVSKITQESNFDKDDISFLKKYKMYYMI